MTSELTIGELTELTEDGTEKRADYIAGWSDWVLAVDE